MTEGPWEEGVPFFDDALASNVSRIGRQKQQEKKPPDPIEFLTIDDCLAKPLLRWRVAGILPIRGVAMMYGEAGSGKTFLAWDLLCAIAEGGLWFGSRVFQAKALYCGFEGRDGVFNRIKAYVIAKGKKPDVIVNVKSDWFLNDISRVMGFIDDAEAAGLKGGVIVIDTLNRATPGIDENSGKDMGQALHAANVIMQALDCLVILVHHTGKDASKGPRGHTVINGNLDTLIEVHRKDDLRSFGTGKVKDGPDDHSFGFKLVTVELGLNEDGVAVTSCVIEPSHEVQTKSTMLPRQPAGVNQQVALEGIRVALDRARNKPPSPHVPDGKTYLSTAEAIEAASEGLAESGLEPKKAKYKAKSVLPNLIRQRFLGHNKGNVWWL